MQSILSASSTDLRPSFHTKRHLLPIVPTLPVILAKGLNHTTAAIETNTNSVGNKYTRNAICNAGPSVISILAEPVNETRTKRLHKYVLNVVL